MQSAFKSTAALADGAERDPSVASDTAHVTAASPANCGNVVAFFGNRGHWGYYDCNWWEIRMAQASERELARAA